jgi:hypothetical protein
VAANSLAFICQYVDITDEAGGAAGAIPRCVQMLGPGSPTLSQKAAANALRGLAQTAETAVNIAAAGAIPALVRLLRPGSPADVKGDAARALRAIVGGCGNAANRGAVAMLL